MSETLRKICNVAAGVLAVLVIGLAILLAGVRLFGLRVLIVLSGSMEPTYETGSLIYVKKADCASLGVGDPITYRLGSDTKKGTVVTHRIVEVVKNPQNPASLSFRTKGDDNPAADGGLVPCGNIIGKPVFHIPKLGYLANYIQHPPGVYVAVSVGALLLLLIFLPDVFDGSKNKKQRLLAEQAQTAESGGAACGEEKAGANSNSAAEEPPEAAAEEPPEAAAEEPPEAAGKTTEEETKNT